jgi:cytochrome c-type biogenesis protein CcmE
MTRKQRRAVLIGACLGVITLAVGLVLMALRDSIVFFFTPTEVAEKLSARASVFAWAVWSKMAA